MDTGTWFSQARGRMEREAVNKHAHTLHTVKETSCVVCTEEQAVGPQGYRDRVHRDGWLQRGRSIIPGWNGVSQSEREKRKQQALTLIKCDKQAYLGNGRLHRNKKTK